MNELIEIKERSIWASPIPWGNKTRIHLKILKILHPGDIILVLNIIDDNIVALSMYGCVFILTEHLQIQKT